MRNSLPNRVGQPIFKLKSLTSLPNLVAVVYYLELNEIVDNGAKPLNQGNTLSSSESTTFLINSSVFDINKLKV